MALRWPASAYPAATPSSRSRWSRGSGRPPLTEEDAVRFGPTPVGREGAPYPHDPLFRKDFLQLSPPTLGRHIWRPGAHVPRTAPAPRHSHHADGPVQTQAAADRCCGRRLADHRHRSGSAGGTVEVVQIEGGDTSARNYGVAVDVGTTTVVAPTWWISTSSRDGGAAGQVQLADQLRRGHHQSHHVREHGREAADSSASVVVNDINDLIAALTVETKTGLRTSPTSCAPATRP